MNILRVKDGVQFTQIAPAGFRLLSALESTARALGVDLTITCACEGHPSTDPHTLGAAYDVRTHDLTAAQKQAVLRTVMLALADNHGQDAPLETAGGLATVKFFAWIEHPGAPNEHLHAQQRHGASYP